MAGAPTFVIVGASLAGATAAETLRSEGFEGSVVLVGEEPSRPYERPPLSKDYLRGASDFDKAAVHEPSFYADHDIDLRTSTRVVALDAKARQVTLAPGGTLSFDQLLLATGAEPRRLVVAGGDLAGIHYLRSIASCDALKAALASASRVVVVGGGWIGTEVAASARQLGKDVALVEAGAVPLERPLGAEVGGMFRDLHAAHGVELHLGVGVEAFRGSGHAEEVVLADGRSVAGDCFVVGIGVRPRTELAEGAGLRVEDGVVVDEHLATSAGGIFAAGDVANAWHPGLGRRIRLEHWSAARNQGPAAARNMLGQQTAYTKTPYFFSDQYELGMEHRGVTDGFDQVVLRGDRDRLELLVFWLGDGRVQAAMNVNVWDVGDHLEALVANRRAVDPEALADPSSDLAALAAG